MSMDPNIAVHYNLQNDLGNNTLTNMAVSNQDDPSLVPSVLDGRMLDWNNNFKPFSPQTSSPTSTYAATELKRCGLATGDSTGSLP